MVTGRSPLGLVCFVSYVHKTRASIDIELERYHDCNLYRLLHPIDMPTVSP